MNYGMGGTILSKTVMEKGLGVTMNANMKVSEQCRIAASKGNQQGQGPYKMQHIKFENIRGFLRTIFENISRAFT